MKELINRKDINGIQLREGDIVAECKIGKEIWEGAGIVESRPLGVVVVYHNNQAAATLTPEETDVYNISPLRKGSVKLTEKAKPWMLDRLGNEYGYSELNISRYDGDFYAWDNIERIGSIYDFPN